MHCVAHALWHSRCSSKAEARQHHRPKRRFFATRRQGSWKLEKSTASKIYKSLHSGDRLSFVDCLVSSLSVGGDPTLDAVRCVGNHNRDDDMSRPRSHHEFLVLGHLDANTDFHPHVVWTGSFNFTQNSVLSFENAVMIRDEKIVDAFYNGWAQVTSLSEPLDWTSKWVDPEFKIGT